MTDLPTNLTGTTRSAILVDVLEATGYGPESELVAETIDLLNDDMHTSSPYAMRSKIPSRSDGSLSYSAERWLRLRFTPPFGAVSNLRFWVPNYNPNSGWQLYWGTTDTYTKPRTVSPSNLAIYPVATSEPQTGNLNSAPLTGGKIAYSMWVVLQAARFPTAPAQLQAEPLNYSFGWSES